MAWERRVSERTKEEKKYASNSSYGENITQSNYVETSMSGGLSFCPKCGSMMLERDGISRCNGCGYTDYSESYHTRRRNRYEENLERQRKQRLKEQETRSQMNSVLRAMRQGKTRPQAAQYSGVPLSRINHWYREGLIGTTADTSHFYREVRLIEEDRERRERERINRQNRIDQERRERRQRLEKQRKEREREERLRRKESRQRDQIIRQMKNGKTRQQAANYVGVSISTVNEWYEKGRRRKGNDYVDFYNELTNIENKPKRQSRPKVRKTTKYIPLTKSSYSRDEKMEEVVSLMKNGYSRNKAADKVKISVITINNWYDKGRRGEVDFIDFYKNVESIENTGKKSNISSKPKLNTKHKKQTSKPKLNTGKKSNISSKPKLNTKHKKQTSKPKSTSTNKVTSNNIKCRKCGNMYNKLLYDECPSCKRSKNLNVTKKDSFDWLFCCGVIFVIFIIIIFLSMI